MEFSLDSLQPKERASFALRALYEAAGCRKYHMGRFEEYGLYQENRSFLSSEQVITFTDLDGRLLALKPDVTLSIAKTAQPAPGETLRYYYHENVYRPSAESHTFQEISQMGLEMLGAVGEAQVQQAVRLAAQSLAQLGAAWVLEVSHMGYLFGLFDAPGVPENASPGLLEKLREKNAHELRRAAQAAGLDAARAAALTGLLELSGSCEETLAKAESACRNDRMRAAAAELRALAKTLEASGGAVRFDLSLAGEMEYYNGLVFQGYLQGLPRPLLKGGRYDLLMQKFTPGAGAIGFAVYLDELDRLSAPTPPVQRNSTDRASNACPRAVWADRMYDLLACIGYGCTATTTPPESWGSRRTLRRASTLLSSPAMPSTLSTARQMWASRARISSPKPLPMSTSCWIPAFGRCRMVWLPRRITRMTPAARCGWRPNSSTLQRATMSIGRDIDIIKLNGPLSWLLILGLSDVTGYRGDRHHPENGLRVVTETAPDPGSGSRQ